MRVIVLVKEIFDTRDLLDVPLDHQNHIKIDTLESRFDPEDMNALEMALKLKDEHGWKVTVLSVGAPRRLDVLRESLYRGVDEVIRLEDEAFVSLDSGATALVFEKAIQRIGHFDLILTGLQITEGENSLLGCHIGAALGIEPITYVDQIEGIEEGKISVRRAIEGGIEIVQSPLPALLVVGVALIKEDPRSPRSARAKLKLKYKKTAIPVWGLPELSFGEKGPVSSTSLKGYERVILRDIPHKRVDGKDIEELKEMVRELKQRGALR